MMKIRTQLKAGALVSNHNEALIVRSTVKAGALIGNHSEVLRVRSTVKAGGASLNHSEALKAMSEQEPTNWRQALLTLQLICPFCYVDATHIERRGHQCHCTECQQDWDRLTVSERRFLRSIRIQAAA